MERNHLAYNSNMAEKNYVNYKRDFKTPKHIKEGINNYLDPISIYRYEGRYNIHNDNFNKQSYEIKRKMKFAKDINDYNVNKGISVSIPEMKNLKCSVLRNQNAKQCFSSNNIFACTDNKASNAYPINQNNSRFYKNQFGDQIRLPKDYFKKKEYIKLIKIFLEI